MADALAGKLIRIGAALGLGVLSIISPVRALAAGRPVLTTLLFADYKPYCYVEADGAPAGFVVELARAVADEAGYDLSINVSTLAEAKTALETGRIDFLPIMAYSAARDEIFDFTPPYAIADDAIFHNKNGPSPERLEELKGLRVVGTKNDTALEYILANGIAAKESMLLKASVREVLSALNAGEADAAVLPKMVAMNQVIEIGLDNVVPARTVVTEYNRPYSIAVREGNAALLGKLNRALTALRDNGKHEELYRKWFAVRGPDPDFMDYPEAKWLILAVFAATGGVFLVALINRRLDRLVEKKTSEALAATERVRAREVEFREIITRSNEPIAILCGEKVKFVSDSFKELFRITPGNEPSDPRPLTFIAPEERDRLAEILNLRDGGDNSPKRYVTKGLRMDGTAFDLEVSSTVYESEGERNTLVVARDVTEKKLKEEKLLRDAAIRQLAEEAGSIGVWSYDLSTGESYWSEEMWPLCCLDRNKFKPSLESSYAAVHPEDLENSKRCVAEVTEAQSDFNLEYRIKTPTGEPKWLLARGRPFPTASGGVRYVGITVDITRRKLAELELTREKERARQFLDIAGVITVALDRAGKVLLANRKACETLGWREEELVGRDWFTAAVPGHEAERLREVFLALMAGGGQAFGYVENQVKTKAGDLRTVAWRNALLRDSGGKVVAILSSGEDVTEKRELELQLQQAQKMEALGTLAGGIAHDFNNILAAIMGYAELSLHLAEPGTEMADNLADILTAGRRARDLVRRIMAFARKSRETPGPVDAPLIAGEAVKLLRSTVPTTITIELDISEPPPPPVLGTPTQLHQVIMNLTTNAYQALKESGGHIRISLSTEPVGEREAERLLVKPGEYVKLTVADDGPGIPPELAARIFEPFFTTKERGEGTGLGLSAVHTIARSLGGAVEAGGEVGRGAVFTVILPAAHGVEKLVPDHGEGRSEEQAAKGRVLVVDDEESLAKLLARVLMLHGMEAEWLTSPRAALAALREAPEKYDAVVTDQTMPGMSGGELFRLAREAGVTTPFIVCTGYSDVLDAHEAARLGFFAYLRKPASHGEVVETVARALAFGERAGIPPD